MIRKGGLFAAVAAMALSGLGFAGAASLQRAEESDFQRLVSIASPAVSPDGTRAATVNDWSADYGTADDSLSDVDLFHGSPFVGDNAAEWRRASAISYVADVTTPVLILSDVGDNRDSFATSSMYWRALRDNHKDATLRVWPVDGHFPSDPVRGADVYHYWIDFIARHFNR